MQTSRKVKCRPDQSQLNRTLNICYINHIILVIVILKILLCLILLIVLHVCLHHVPKHCFSKQLTISLRNFSLNISKRLSEITLEMVTNYTSGWKVIRGDKICQTCKIECIKRTNPSNLIVETDNNRSEGELYAIEMSVTNDATPTNYNRMLEDIDLSLFKTHTVVTHSHKY